MVSVLKCYPQMSILDAKRVTLSDFEVMTEAYRLRQIDDLLNIHLQAWTNSAVQQTEKNGKPKYRRFSQFFNYEEMVNEVQGGDKQIEVKDVNTNIYKKLSQLNKAGDK